MKEGFVPENYIRVWNPVDDVGDGDMNEVNVDDDIALADHRLAPSDNCKYTNSDSELIDWHFLYLAVFVTCNCQCPSCVLFTYMKLCVYLS